MNRAGLLAFALALFLWLAPNSAADPFPAAQRAAVDVYAADYGTYQGWQIADASPVRGDWRRAHYRLHYLANPAPGAAACFVAAPTIDDGCPAKWYVGGIELYLNVDARVARCGPGWFVVSTPLDRHTCATRLRLPRW